MCVCLTFSAAAHSGLFDGGLSLCVVPPRTKGIGNVCSVRVLQADSTSMQVGGAVPVEMCRDVEMMSFETKPRYSRM